MIETGNAYIEEAVNNTLLSSISIRKFNICENIGAIDIIEFVETIHFLFLKIYTPLTARCIPLKHLELSFNDITKKY